MGKRNKLILATFLVALCCSESALGEICFKNGSPHVKLSSRADVSGKTLFSRQGRPYLEFLNIPYATVPERFAASELISEPTWEGVRNGSTNGPMCPQMEVFGNPTPLGDENCLHLSIYVPLSTKPRKKLAVMVYVHGGGFGMGSGDQMQGKFVADEEVILVNFNYRVNVFGFLSTHDSVVPGNNGLKDQVVALKWVQENIHRFGGDKSRVNIFGISAGGASTHYLYLSESAKGLFHNVISQSGTALSFWGVDTKPREKAVQLANFLNCDTSASNPEDISSQEIVSCLKKVPRDELTKAAIEFIPAYIPSSNLGGLFNFGPVAEKNSPSPFLTESQISLFENSGYPHPEIPLMIGMCRDEGATLSGGSALKDLGDDLNTKWQEVAPAAFLLDRFLPTEEQITVVEKIRKFYFQGKPISKETRKGLFDAYSDAWGLFGARKSALMTAARGANHQVYLYVYSYLGKSVSPFEAIFEVDAADKLVVHGADFAPLTDFSAMLEVFGMPPELAKTHPDDVAFSLNHVRLWTSFAKNGKPGHTWGNAKDKVWMPISKEEAEGKKPLRWYNIDENPGHIEEPFAERMKFWNDLWEEHFLPNAKKAEGKTEL